MIPVVILSGKVVHIVVPIMHHVCNNFIVAIGGENFGKSSLVGGTPHKYIFSSRSAFRLKGWVFLPVSNGLINRSFHRFSQQVAAMQKRINL